MDTSWVSILPLSGVNSRILAPSHFPAFHSNVPFFLRISSWKKCALRDLLIVKWNSEDSATMQLPVLGKGNSLCSKSRVGPGIKISRVIVARAKSV